MLTVREQATDPLHRWLAEHLLPGAVLNVGGAMRPLSSQADGYMWVTVKHLASAVEYEAVFDHGWVNDALVMASDPADVVQGYSKRSSPAGRFWSRFRSGCRVPMLDGRSMRDRCGG